MLAALSSGESMLVYLELIGIETHDELADGDAAALQNLIALARSERAGNRR